MNSQEEKTEQSREPAENLLSVRNLTITYETEDKIVRAVNDVSFDVARGETLGLVGETGAGKTTIAYGISRLISEPPGKYRAGEIWFQGKELRSASESQMRKIRGEKISMIFQDPMTALNPIDTVEEQIAEVIRLHRKVSRGEAVKQALEVLTMVGIPAERGAEYPHQFSGGMKQRIVIAIALACRPQLLIADEPTTALDVTIQAQVLEMMDSLKRELGTSMILITHDLGVVAEMCDKVAIVYAGEIVECGTLEHIFEQKAHPYTEGLFGSLPSLTDMEARLKPIKGLMPDPTDLPEGCKFHPRCPYCTEECSTRHPELRETTPGHLVRCLHLGCVKGENEG